MYFLRAEINFCHDSPALYGFNILDDTDYKEWNRQKNIIINNMIPDDDYYFTEYEHVKIQDVLSSTDIIKMDSGDKEVLEKYGLSIHGALNDCLTVDGLSKYYSQITEEKK